MDLRTLVISTTISGALFSFFSYTRSRVCAPVSMFRCVCVGGKKKLRDTKGWKEKTKRCSHRRVQEVLVRPKISAKDGVWTRGGRTAVAATSEISYPDGREEAGGFYRAAARRRFNEGRAIVDTRAASSTTMPGRTTLNRTGSSLVRAQSRLYTGKRLLLRPLSPRLSRPSIATYARYWGTRWGMWRSNPPADR